MPNDILFPLSAVNSHNGDISNEAKLIFVLDSKSGLPLYFRYAAGNIVDAATLKTTLCELHAYGIDVERAIIDAGYYSEGNIKELQRNQISFVMRQIPNRKRYTDLVAQYTANLDDAKNLVKCRERLVYVIRIPRVLFGKEGYAYLEEEIDRKHDEIKKYARAALENNDLTTDEMDEAMRTKGLYPDNSGSH
ncbi:MAG: transposase [Bacillota bacterium]|nr:transposase [Bacillota bacterium]